MPKNVLIIDDDQANVKYLSALLRENGFQPHAAADGAQGLQAAATLRPDLIVLDVMMPRKSGYAVFGELKRDPALQAIPVIMLTAVQEVLDVEMAGESKSDTLGELKDPFREMLSRMTEAHRAAGEVRPERFLDKPIEPEAFLAAVQQLIGRG
jgi:CheY-like chemotaxis protein